MKIMKVTNLLLFFAFLGISSSAFATSYVFDPTPVDVYDLDHYKYYTWGINWNTPSGEKITAATLAFNNIRNWNDRDHVLYGHLLNNPAVGVAVSTDSQGGGNAFVGQGEDLFTWRNTLPFSAGVKNVSHIFNTSDLIALNIFTASGTFGFGFDPDCHFWNDGIRLTVDTSPVPEPTTMLLLGTGIIGLVGSRLRSKKKL